MLNKIQQIIIEKSKEILKHNKILFLVIVLSLFTMPNVSISATADQGDIQGPVPQYSLSSYYNGPTLPNIPIRSPRRTMTIAVTAYNSEEAQTDDTPFITAFGTRVRDGIVAANFLPKGAIIRIPEVFGEKEFIVEDRMNKKYHYRIDIWMEDKQEAINFGIKFLKIEIL